MRRLTAPGRRAAVALASAVALTGILVGGYVWDTEVKDDEPNSGPETSSQGRPAPPRQPVPETIAHAPEGGGKAVTITIDDGPDPNWTPRVLEVLEANDVRAVFCMVGPAARAHPELVRKVVAAGHRLCDHTMDHDVTMDTKPVAYQRQQILDAQRLIEAAAGGAKVEYYRAPGGAFTPDSRKIAAAQGMRPLGWNVDTKDFELPGTDQIVRTIKEQLRRGPTILFHDGGGERAQTVEALRQILPWLHDQGYRTAFPVIR